MSGGGCNRQDFSDKISIYWFDMNLPVRKNPPTPLIRGALVCERQPENNQPIKAKPEISNQIGIKQNLKTQTRLV